MKKNIVYFILLIALAAFWFGMKTREQNKGRQAKVNRNRLVFEHFQKEDIAFIEMELPGERIYLELKGHDWCFQDNHLPANNHYVDMLLKCFETLTYGDYVSSSVEDHYLYRLDSKSRLVVLRDRNEREITRLYIGKPGENYRTAFFRQGDSADVYHTVTDFFITTNRPTWYDRQIWNVPESAVQFIVLKDGQREIRLSSTDSKWMDHLGRPCDAKAIHQILNLQAGDAYETCQQELKQTGSMVLDLGVNKMTLHLYREGQTTKARRQSTPDLTYVLSENILAPFFDGKNTDQENH